MNNIFKRFFFSSGKCNSYWASERNPECCLYVETGRDYKQVRLSSESHRRHVTFLASCPGHACIIIIIAFRSPLNFSRIKLLCCSQFKYIIQIYLNEGYIKLTLAFCASCYLWLFQIASFEPFDIRTVLWMLSFQLFFLYLIF